jgi:hypothetical protein
VLHEIWDSSAVRLLETTNPILAVKLSSWALEYNYLIQTIKPELQDPEDRLSFYDMYRLEEVITGQSVY